MSAKRNLCKDLIRVNLPDVKIKNKVLRRTVKAFAGGIYGVSHISSFYNILCKDYLVIPQIDFVITTRCSLRCRECANLMPYFKEPETYSVEFLKEELDKLLEYVDEIHELRVLGGEPFIHPHLNEILDYAVTKKKINRIVIFTNGTVLPKNDLLIESLRKKKISITISDYGTWSKEMDNLLELCKKNKIKCGVKFIPQWVSFGGLQKRKRTAEELKEQVRKCDNVCKSYLEGKIYWCERQASGNKLGLIKSTEKEYIDVMNNTGNIEQVRKRILDYCYNTRYIGACMQCDKGTDACKEVPMAEQVKKGELL